MQEQFVLVTAITVLVIVTIAHATATIHVRVTAIIATSELNLISSICNELRKD
jgi:hypothetical protein